jgi:hypothetical protein
MGPPPRKSSSVALVVGGWLLSVILCAPLCLLAGIALADLLAPATGRPSGDATWFLLGVSMFLLSTILATAAWCLVWRRTRYRPSH